MKSITESTWLSIEKKNSLPKTTPRDNLNFNKTHDKNKLAIQQIKQNNNNKEAMTPSPLTTIKNSTKMNKWINKSQQQQQQQLQDKIDQWSSKAKENKK